MVLFRIKPLSALIAAWTFVPVVRGGGYDTVSYDDDNYHDDYFYYHGDDGFYDHSSDSYDPPGSDSHDSDSSDSHDYCDSIGTFKN